jgi:serine/threonine protein kinase
MIEQLDVNPNNIFISHVDGPSPIVKLGDLGTSLYSSTICPLSTLTKIVIKEGFNRQRLQSLPCRAPEVWQGKGCFHSSDVWSVGVTVSYTQTPLSSRLIKKLAHWLYGRAIFGASDKLIEGHTEAWCIAKLQSLVGKLGTCVDYPPYKDEFEFAEQLASMKLGPGLGKLIKVNTLRQELQPLSDPPVSTQLLDFIDYLLVIDMT